jgi:hypothetical protein
MEKLHKLDYCPEFAHDLLRIIHQGLLHPDKRQRWDCTEIVTELGRIRQRCGSSNKAYCEAPSNWEGGPLEAFTVSVRNKLSFLAFSKGSIVKAYTTSMIPTGLIP